MHNCGTLLTFGDRILVAGYSTTPTASATTGPPTASPPPDHTCEGEVELVSISDGTFETTPLPLPGDCPLRGCGMSWYKFGWSFLERTAMLKTAPANLSRMERHGAG